MSMFLNRGVVVLCAVLEVHSGWVESRKQVGYLYDLDQLSRHVCLCDHYPRSLPFLLQAAGNIFSRFCYSSWLYCIVYSFISKHGW